MPYRTTRSDTCGYTRPRALMQFRMREQKGNHCRYRTFTKFMSLPFEFYDTLEKTHCCLVRKLIYAYLYYYKYY